MSRVFQGYVENRGTDQIGLNILILPILTRDVVDKKHRNHFEYIQLWSWMSRVF